MKVSLHDVHDVEGFVKATLKRSGITFGRAEYEELVAEGLMIMVDLANRYDPSLETNPAKASFAGYAHYLLPRKLTDSWHKMNPHHVLRTQPDGKRRWTYHQPPESLDAQMSYGGRGGRRDESVNQNAGGIDELGLRTPGDFVAVPLSAPVATAA